MRSSFLHPFARPAADRFIEIVRGEGAAVWDAEGNRYVDALASLWYCQVGHGRAEIADAVDAQMRTIEAFHTFEMFTNGPAEEFCAMVAERMPMDRARVFLTSSGSEAVDTAMKLARLHWSWQGEPDRTVVVSRDRGYHGVAYGGTSAQGLPPNKEHWGPLLSDVVHTDADDLAKVEATFEEHGERMAAFIAEPVQGAAGVFTPQPGYLEGLRRLCDEYGALLIFDEVICAFGRLGAWSGAEHYGVVPDAITFAKGATSGYLPVGGVVLGPKVLDVLEGDDERWLRHGFTYSGHPSACAAGVANLEVIEAEGLLARAPAIGARLEPGLRSLVEEGLASALRGTQAIWGLAMNEGVSAMDVRDEMLTRGVIPRPIATHSLAFCPPLVIEDDDLDRILDATAESLRAVIGAR
jgi:adenosylmethionine-8-amino-7-oxononanoate aminotransferase